GLSSSFLNVTDGVLQASVLGPALFTIYVILRTLMGHKANITSLGFHPFGDFLASSSMDTNIKLWDVRRKGYVFRYKGHTQAVRSLAFSPDGKWLASASDDCTVKLWDLAQGKTITEFKSHTAAVNIVQFHPNEYLLASGSSDRTIKLWDLEKFTMIGSLEGDTTPVRCICFSPDGSCLYSGATDSLRVFGWEPDRCFDAVPVSWGKVSDLAICNQQLIGVSHQLSSVSSYVVDLKRVKKSGGAVIQGIIQDDQPLTELKHRSESDRRSPEGERRSPSEDEADEKLSSAEIHNPEDYKAIFQPKNAICRWKRSVAGPPLAASTPVVRVEPTVISAAKRPSPPAAGTVTWSTFIVRRWSRAPLPPVLNLNLPRCRQCVGNSIIQSASFSVRFLSYIQTGCTSLKLVMKHFWTLISDTLKATPSVGVDITREERHQKCRVCCKQLKNLSNIVKNKATQVGRHGSTFKELQLLMAPLDDSP
uniref:Katanin p80 (WD repeat containing) subunit B 1 n=1 Tax=Neolamprologus brichardi TaxID=32507 RepID=A0A3Q4I4P8_NEOBR